MSLCVVITGFEFKIVASLAANSFAPEWVSNNGIEYLPSGDNATIQDPLCFFGRLAPSDLIIIGIEPVSYTHLTLPTIYSV